MRPSWNQPTVLAFFLLLGLLSSGCGGRKIEESRLSGEENLDLPDQVFEGFEMTITESGIKKGWIRAERAEKYSGKKIFKAEGLTVLFYDTNGEIKSILTSRHGLIHTDSGDMEAIDSVVVFTSDSTRQLVTEHLVWKKKENLIVGDSAVVIRSRRGVVFGDGITADAGLEDIEVKNPTGDIHVLGNKI